MNRAAQHKIGKKSIQTFFSNRDLPTYHPLVCPCKNISKQYLYRSTRSCYINIYKGSSRRGRIRSRKHHNWSSSCCCYSDLRNFSFPDNQLYLVALTNFVLKMNAHGALETTLRELIQAVSPQREDWLVRSRIIDDLRGVVESIESLRGATVEPYGSFVSDLFTRWGDLDVSVELWNNTHIAVAGKKQKLSLLEDLRQALRRRGGLRKIVFVPNARVPILKFESNYMSISCDISVSNLTGQMKSKLLYWISNIDGRFRKIVLLAKEWAKACGINDPRAGTLNSYTLSLLVIFHFQTCVPAILPPLKDIYPENMVDNLRGARLDAEKYVEDLFADHVGKLSSDRSRRTNPSSVSELFLSFLAKFSDIDSRAAEQGICLYSGRWEDISGNTRWLPRTYALFVEDPFEQPANPARTVRGDNLTKIAEAFRTTYDQLLSPNLTRSCIIQTLVRPHISQLLLGPPLLGPPPPPNGYHHHHHQGGHPQMYRGGGHPQMRRPGQSKNKSTGVNGHPSNGGKSQQRNRRGGKSASHGGDNQTESTAVNGHSSNGAVKKDPSSSQQKQVWKPKADK